MYSEFHEKYVNLFFGISCFSGAKEEHGIEVIPMNHVWSIRTITCFDVQIYHA